MIATKAIAHPSPRFSMLAINQIAPRYIARIETLQRESFPGSEFVPPYSAFESGDAFGVVATIAEDVIGFCFQRRIGERTCGHGAILLTPEMRGRRVAKAMIEVHHRQAPADIELFVVVDTHEGFWRSVGYQLVERTSTGQMFLWRRPRRL